ncbi:unnamed protein product [Calypogeia fissa]
MASMPPAELEQQSVKQLRDFSFTLREGRTEDAQALGVICFVAFKAFNESVGTDYKMDSHSIEMSVEVIRACLEGPGTVGLALNPDAVVRLMQEADVAACAQFFKDTNGYERLPALQRVLGPHAWVITSKEGEMLGYTTGFALFKHTCVRSESDFVTLYHGMTKNVQITCLMTLSTSHYPKLAQWALAAGLRLKRHNWYMVNGDFQAPKDNRVYFPNALH